MTHHDVDAVIIGAGVIGAATAFELARRGWRTLSVDALPAAGFGSTSNSCAIVRFTYSTYDGVAMAWEGVHYWTDWAAYLGAPDERGLARYVQCGTLLLAHPGGHHEKVLPLFDEIGVPYEHWSLDTLRDRMPAFDVGRFGPPRPVDDEAFWEPAAGALTGAVWTPHSGYVSDPQLASHNLQRAAEAHGARFVFATRVTGIRRSAGRVSGVTLDDGSTVSASVVVNVAGPHSAVVNDLAGLTGSMRIGTRPLRHEVHHVPAPASLDYERTGVHVSDGDTGVYFRPETGNAILVGSEDPACDERQWVDDPDDFDRAVTSDQWSTQVLRLARRIPDLGVPNQRRGVVDLYDVADDWIPIYDRTDLDGFYVAIGTSGNQFKNAGVAGHCVAELIAAVEGGYDHDGDPLIVRGRYTDLPLRLGSFSRNREINPDSSFSVNG